MNTKVELQENKMGTMPVMKLIINMSLPIMISMLLTAFYNIVDSYFVAKISQDAFTAVSLAFPIQNLMISFAVGTSIGVNSFLAKRLGQKNQEDVNRSAMNGILLAVLNYILFLLFGLFFIKTYVSSQTPVETIIKYGIEYLSIIIFWSFGIMCQCMFDRLLQATGKTFFSMISQLSGAIFNIIFDPILIFGLGPFKAMGIKGAAYATVFGQVLGLIVSVYLNLRYNKEIQFKIKNLIPKWEIIKNIYKVGIPSILMNSITSFITYFMNLILGQFSMTAINVYGAFIKMNSFVFMPVFGLNSGIIPIIAYNYGAQHKERIKKTIKGGLLAAFAIMTVGVLAFELIPGILFRLFSADEEMLKIGIPAFRTIAPSFLGAAFAITLSSVFQAFGRALYSMTVSFSRQLVVFLPSAYLLSKTGNVNNVWFCFLIAEIMSVGVSFIFYQRIKSKIQKLPDNI